MRMTNNRKLTNLSNQLKIGTNPKIDEIEDQLFNVKHDP